MDQNLKLFIDTEGGAIAFESLFQHASIGIIISNAQGVIEQVNPYANQLLGYDEQELHGQAIEVLLPTALREQHIQHRFHYNEKPKNRAMGIGLDLLAVRKDGKEFPIEISLASYQIAGKKQIVSFLSDITERKKNETTLKQLNAELEQKVQERTQELSRAFTELHQINRNLEQEMERRKKVEEEMRKTLDKERELNELKSRFVSMASHEFRTPLAGILTSAALISRYQDPIDRDRQDKHLRTIKNSVKNLTLILNDFLSIDKLEAGKISSRPTLFSLTDFVLALIEEMQDVVKKEQKLTYLCSGVPFLVHADQDFLRNILMNLISNAIKYSFEATPIQIQIFFQEHEVQLTIKDQGIGIPENDQKYLFERFFRAQNAMNISGTGLGLHIIQKYLELMHGSLTFKSQENVGSEFTVTLPREQV